MKYLIVLASLILFGCSSLHPVDRDFVYTWCAEKCIDNGGLQNIWYSGYLHCGCKSGMSFRQCGYDNDGCCVEKCKNEGGIVEPEIYSFSCYCNDGGTISYWGKVEK